MKIKLNLKTLFEEKKLEYRTYTVSHNDTVHMIESDFLINMIINHTPTEEQKKILEAIMLVDFVDGDVHHFLEHLAKAYVYNNY